MKNTEKKTTIEESPEFLEAWNSPVQPHNKPEPVIETPGFIAAWTWPRPACEISQEEAASLNTLYSGVEA